MKKIFGLFFLLGGLYSQVSSAQLFLGVGANAQFAELKDSFVGDADRSFSNDKEAIRYTWSPAIRTEYVLSADVYLSGTFSHLSIQDYDFETQNPSSVFTTDKVRGIQGRLMSGWVFDHFGLEGGVVLLQSYKNERTLVTPASDPQSSIVDITTSDKGFTQLYPCVSGTYKYGQWLGVLSGTFSSNRFRPSGQRITTVVPQATISFGVFYIWKAFAAPRLTSPRF